jgi:dCTP deaminase
MILSDRDIRAAMQRLENALVIDPVLNQRRMQPASVELLLDPVISTRKGKKTDLGIRNASGGLHWPHGYPMRPGQFLLASTVEKVHIPTDMCAQVNGKSSWGRLGLTVHVTAGFIDPGFKGRITLELANLSEETITLKPHLPICQLVFMPLSSPAERPYGHKDLGSHYQGQTGVTRSFMQV